MENWKIEQRNNRTTESGRSEKCVFDRHSDTIPQTIRVY